MSLRVLLVDDDDLFRSALAHAIQAGHADADIVEASSEAAAVRRLAKGGLDLLITDVSMGRPNAGWRLARRARQLGVPVLLMTGFDHTAALGDLAPLPLVSKRELDVARLAGFITCALSTQPDAAGPSDQRGPRGRTRQDRRGAGSAPESATGIVKKKVLPLPS